VLLAVGALAGFALIGRGGDESATAQGGLPATSDYHSLLVDPDDPSGLLLGTHDGLYRSSDGGSTWRFDALAGQDAMNLARPTAATVWAAGHNVLARSEDGGSTWIDITPSGLPGLDVHGFAVDPRNPKRAFAAIAGTGLYRTTDEGESFEQISAEVGPNVMALAVATDGRLLAGDMEQGLLSSADDGRTWSRVHDARVMGLAVNPRDPDHVLAGGDGVLLSTDGAKSWKKVLAVPDGVGPVAWSASNPDVAFAVGFDRLLYRTADGGQTWTPVDGGAA
jgi:photosystem II stability/assembly factor-like uncharacterized protein